MAAIWLPLGGGQNNANTCVPMGNSPGTIFIKTFHFGVKGEQMREGSDMKYVDFLMFPHHPLETTFSEGKTKWREKKERF